MTLKKEISSTEKLLEVIRRKKAPHVPDMTPRPQQRAGKKPSLIKALTSQRGTHSVGVDFGYRHLFLVKVCRHSEDHWTLCDYRTVPLPADGSRNTPAFGEFVKRELDSFCGQERNVGIWANMSSAKAEVSAIRIPKVSRGQLENAVRWNAKKAISLEEGTSILDFKVQGEVIESGVTKLNVLVYAAPRDDVADMRKLFEGIGYSLEGLIISPFGIQNLFGTGWIARKEETVASLYIGRNWSRIDIFNKGVLVMTRDIRAGMNSMIMDLMETYNEGADKTSEEETTVSSAAPVEELIMDIEEARDLVFSLGADVPTTEEIRSRFGLDDESIFKLMNAAVDRLVRQVDRTFRHYTVTLGNEKVTAIYVSSSALVYEPLVTYIGKELAVDHAVLDPLDPDNPSVEDRTAGMTASERAPYSVALGAALSERARTPNFLMTQKDKKKQVNIKLINRS
ncbi:MAG: pilus assembly protein PilM, partial [Deltaproteobacteria bacterium]|nr:pilus assembly protein PilM [Deltaproteobacteria bacterium]